MASAEYMRAYMREYRQGKRLGGRKMVPGSRNWLKARRRALGLIGKRIFPVRERAVAATAFLLVAVKSEEPIGPQVIPFGMTTCPRCDLLTRRRDKCGFCAAEELREEAV